MKNQRSFINEGEAEYMAECGQIIGTSCAYATAWRRLEGGLLNPHGFGALTYTDGPDGDVGSGKALLWGRLGTGPDKALFDDLPAGSQERVDACRAAYEAQYQEAYRLIYEAFPWLRTIPHKESAGEISFSVFDAESAMLAPEDGSQWGMNK